MLQWVSLSLSLCIPTALIKTASTFAPDESQRCSAQFSATVAGNERLVPATPAGDARGVAVA